MEMLVQELANDLSELTEQVEENEGVAQDMLEVLIETKARLDALTELLVASGVIDADSLKALEEVNYQEAVHNITS